MQRRHEPDQPHPGRFPTLIYSYHPPEREPGQDTTSVGLHRLECSCKRGFCETNEPLIARRFAASHMAEHARLRIVDPLEAIADE